MKIRIMTFDDWEGLYINNELVEEGHDIRLSTLVRIIKELGADIKDGYRPDDELEEYGNRCPKTWPENWERLTFSD